MYEDNKEIFDFDPDLKSSTDLLGSPTQINSYSWEVQISDIIKQFITGV